MISEVIHLEESTSEADVLKELDRLNQDDSVSGILVQVPLPDHVDEQKCLMRLIQIKMSMVFTLSISVAYT